MFIELMLGIGLLYLYTWFVWPFVFIFSLVYSIASLTKDDYASMKSTAVAAISLLIILAGIMYPAFR